MAELITAMPWQAWAAGLIAAMVGGLCAAPARREDAGPDGGPHEEQIAVDAFARRGEWQWEVL